MKMLSAKMAAILSRGRWVTCSQLSCLWKSNHWFLEDVATTLTIFKLILWINSFSNSCEITLGWMPQETFDDKSTLVHVMAWCRQATSHYLSQGWSLSMLPYGITRPQWVNSSHISCLWISTGLKTENNQSRNWHHTPIETLFDYTFPGNSWSCSKRFYLKSLTLK